jgi:hypothetical protein
MRLDRSPGKALLHLLRGRAVSIGGGGPDKQAAIHSRRAVTPSLYFERRLLDWRLLLRVGHAFSATANRGSVY